MAKSRSRRNRLGRSRAVALVEVLLSVTILTVGLLVVYRPILSGLTAFAHADQRLEANRLLSNRIWEFETAAKKTGKISTLPENGVLHGTRTFQYTVSPKEIGKSKSLYRFDFFVRWPSGGREGSMRRSVVMWVPHG